MLSLSRLHHVHFLDQAGVEAFNLRGHWQARPYRLSADESIININADTVSTTVATDAALFDPEIF